MSSKSFKTICVFGAGALGGAIAAKLAIAATEDTSISVVARGSHLAGIRAHGLRLRLREADGAEPITVNITATDNPADLPPQDLVITGLKGHQLGAAAEGMAKLLHDHTRVVMILNGIPWWYFHRDTRSGHAERQLEELDPGGALWRLIGPQRVIGCVAHQGAEVTGPGEVTLSNAGQFILGEPAGGMTEDLAAIADLWTQAKIDVSTSERIRDDIWSKLMGNTSFNPISALTRSVMSDMMLDPAIAQLIETVMTEVKSVGEALGSQFALSVDQRMMQARQIGPVRTSMLQDLLARKPLEIVPLVGVVVSLGRLTGTPVPACETIYTLVAHLDRENMRSGN